MKNLSFLLSLMVLTALPLLTTQAFIEKPAQQFKTFAEIQADARAALGAVVDENTQRRNALQALTKSRNSGTNRVKSAKLHFKEDPARVQRSTRKTTTTASNPEFAAKNAQKLSARERIRAALEARRNKVNTREEGIVTNSENPDRKSSFDFVPQPGQIWGR